MKSIKNLEESIFGLNLDYVVINNGIEKIPFGVSESGFTFYINGNSIIKVDRYHGIYVPLYSNEVSGISSVLLDDILDIISSQTSNFILKSAEYKNGEFKYTDITCELDENLFNNIESILESCLLTDNIKISDRLKKLIEYRRYITTSYIRLNQLTRIQHALYYEASEFDSRYIDYNHSEYLEYKKKKEFFYNMTDEQYIDYVFRDVQTDSLKKLTEQLL